MTDRDEDRVLDEEKLRAWPAAEPAPDFAERVIAARRAEVNAAPVRWKRSFLVAGGMAVAAAAAALFFALRPVGGVEVGSLVGDARSEFAIGERAVAVAEGGTALSWRVDGRSARVDQGRGDVFYRVEKGGPFVVATPAGDVIVKGTCFRVEVMDMKIGRQAWGGAAVGALVSAAVLVTVYEGRVLLANERGSTEVKAGERASAGGGAAPGPAVPAVVLKVKPQAQVAEAPPPPADATRTDLLTRDSAQRKEIAELKAQVAALQAQAAAPGGKQRHVESKSFLKPTKDELLAMAKSCTVQFDVPPLNTEPLRFPPRLAEKLGLTADEVALIQRVHADVVQKTLGQLRAIYAEVTGNAAAEDLNGFALMQSIEEKTGRDEGTEARKVLSHERAGLIPPPENLAARPPAERALRVMNGAGDEFERELAKVIGDKAHSLRSADDGWPARGVQTGCQDDEGGEGAQDEDLTK